MAKSRQDPQDPLLLMEGKVQQLIFDMVNKPFFLGFHKIPQLVQDFSQ